MRATSTTSAQWLFPLSALVHQTPSRTTSSIPLEKELYDRCRGVEFLFRLGVSLALPASAMYTAATWFHRFYMRYSMEDYHRQDVAATCIFLATKTEECGRKLHDVAKVYSSKISKLKLEEIADDSREVEMNKTDILLTEEVLLEALCFDFVIATPHAELVDLLDARQEKPEVEEYAWTIANDSYRTPLCILYPAQIIAAACYILAQQYAEGPSSLSLAARVASPAPSASLPTPPSHKSPFPESARFAIEFFKFNEVELASVAEALTILIEHYAAQDIQGGMEYLASLAAIPPPNTCPTHEKLYLPFAPFTEAVLRAHSTGASVGEKQTETPNPPPQQSPPVPQTEDSTPAKATTSKGWKPVGSNESTPGKTLLQRLDLS